MEKAIEEKQPQVTIEQLNGDEILLKVEHKLSRNIMQAGYNAGPNQTKEIWKAMEISITRKIKCSALLDEITSVEELSDAIVELSNIERLNINRCLPAPS
jgi:hypothetical protein